MNCPIIELTAIKICGEIQHLTMSVTMKLYYIKNQLFLYHILVKKNIVDNLNNSIHSQLQIPITPI